MREGMLHIHDVEGPKKTGIMEMRLDAIERQVFKCEGMVERGLNANHMMITEFTNKHIIDANDIGKHLSRLYDRIDQLQAHIYDPQNQNSSNMGVIIPDHSFACIDVLREVEQVREELDIKKSRATTIRNRTFLSLMASDVVLLLV
ncbi:40s ribosomal protein s5-1 [Hordeum vulgare]|nr:40s ribosomal protein s5-1 [Hordeum vulgare]